METRSEGHSTSHSMSRLLQTATIAVSQNPVITLIFAGLITLIALLVTVRFLSFKTNRSDLIDPQSQFQQRWLNYTEKFGDESDVVIVVQSEDEIVIKNVIDQLQSKLEQEPKLFQRILGRIDVSNLKEKGLQYLPPRALELTNDRLELYAPILEGHWNRAGLESYSMRLNEALSSQRGLVSQDLSNTLQQASQFVNSFAAYVHNQEKFVSPWPIILETDLRQRSDQFETRYQLTPSGKMGFVLVTPTETSADFSGGAKSLKRLREICNSVGSENLEATIGMTGITVLEADEMQRSQLDMMKASLISLTGVGCLLLFGFRGIRHPFLALVMLCFGLSWSLGFTTIAVGHLNILSVSFAAILIGLGIDFAIHYLARYLELRHRGKEFYHSLSRTSWSVGPGIVTASITTSLAFFCATFTDFQGVAELGVIAGGGLMLCAVATFTVLPALISLADRKKEVRQLPTPFQGDSLRNLNHQQPGLVATLTLLTIILIGCQGLMWNGDQIESKVKYDANLLNLQAEGLESVDLQKAIFEESSGALLYAVSITDSLPEVRILKEEFLELPTVSRVEEMASYLPAYPPEETNLLVQTIHVRLSRLTDLPREFPQLDPLSIGRSLERLLETLEALNDPIAMEATAKLDQVLNLLTRLELSEQIQLLAEYQGGMLTALYQQLHAIAAISNPEPVSPTDFHPGIRERFVSDSGEWLLRIYPQQQVWEEEPLTSFVEDVRSIDPEVTGTPLQNFEAARQIRESYFHAAIYSLLVICVVLLIDAIELGPLLVALSAPMAVVGFAYTLRIDAGDQLPILYLMMLYVAVAIVVAMLFSFQQVCYVLLTLLPPLSGVFLMFGVLGILGMDLNPANLIVLPLILGIGVDDGVHVVHDYRHSTKPYLTSPSTINAITLTSLTSMVGFGSMAVAAHRGLASLGLVLVIGVGSCLFVSLVTLPALLTLVDRRSPLDASSNKVSDESDDLVSIKIEPQNSGVA